MHWMDDFTRDEIMRAFNHQKNICIYKYNCQNYKLNVSLSSPASDYMQEDTCLLFPKKKFDPCYLPIKLGTQPVHLMINDHL